MWCVKAHCSLWWFCLVFCSNMTICFWFLFPCKESMVFKRKVCIMLFNYCSFGLAVYCYFRHGWYCEAGSILYAYCKSNKVFIHRNTWLKKIHDHHIGTQNRRPLQLHLLLFITRKYTFIYTKSYINNVNTFFINSRIHFISVDRTFNWDIWICIDIQ